MKFKWLLAFSLAFAFPLAAQASRIGKALTTESKGTVFTGSLAEGYHFNKKAPNAAVVDGQTLKPKAVETRKIEFTGLPEKFKEGSAALYVCDDALTFCETRNVNLKSGAAAKAMKASATPMKRGRVNGHGFIENDFAGAMAKAKASGKLALIDFSAPWCPSCVRLEQEIFDTAEFKSATKNFIKLKVDLDYFENSVLAEKYAVRGIPTVLVVDPGQEEVARLLDYHGLEVWKGFFDSVAADPAPLRVLKEKAIDDASRLRLGRRLFYADRAAEAVGPLEKIVPHPKEYLDAKVAGAEKADKPAQIKVYRDAIATEPNSTRSITWRTKLIGVLDNPEDKKTVFAEGLQVADRLLTDPAEMKLALGTDTTGEFTGFERLMLAIYRADLIEAYETKDDAKLAGWNKVVDVGLESKIPVENLGINTRLISFMSVAKRFADSEKLTAAVLKKYPRNFDIQRRRMRALVELKRYDEAIALGPKVLQGSYGRNEVWAAEVLARAYVEAGKNAEAGKLIERYLSRNELDWDSMKSSRKTLEDLQKKIPQG